MNEGIGEEHSFETKWVKNIFILEILRQRRIDKSFIDFLNSYKYYCKKAEARSPWTISMMVSNGSHSALKIHLLSHTKQARPYLKHLPVICSCTYLWSIYRKINFKIDSAVMFQICKVDSSHTPSVTSRYPTQCRKI